jgi:multiple sugar transport system substrate-binding protein
VFLNEPGLRRIKNPGIMTGMNHRSAIRHLVHGLACLALVTTIGCEPRKIGTVSQTTETPSITQSTAPLVVVVCDDGPLAAAIETEWRASSGSGIHVEQSSFVAMAKSDRPADVIVCAPCQIGDLVAQQRLRPLTGAAEPVWVDLPDFFPLTRQLEMQWGKQRYAISLGSPQLVLFFDHRRFEQQGLAPPTTWQEYGKVVEALHAIEPPGVAAEPLGPGWAARMFIARAAGYARDPSQYSCLFNFRTMTALIAAPPFVRALDELRASAAKLPNDVWQSDPDAIMKRFVRGELAMAIGWPSAGRGDTFDPRPDWRPGVAMLPGSIEFHDGIQGEWRRRAQHEIQVPVLGFSGRCVGIARGTKNIPLANNFVTWLSSREQGPKVTSRSTHTTIFRASQRTQADSWVEGPLSPIAREYFDLILRNQSSTVSLAALQIPGQHEYMQVLDDAIRGSISSGEPSSAVLTNVTEQWERITDRIGRDKQIEAYRKSLGIQ